MAHGRDHISPGDGPTWTGRSTRAPWTRLPIDRRITHPRRDTQRHDGDARERGVFRAPARKRDDEPDGRHTRAGAGGDHAGRAAAGDAGRTTAIDDERAATDGRAREMETTGSHDERHQRDGAGAGDDDDGDDGDGDERRHGAPETTTGSDDRTRPGDGRAGGEGWGGWGERWDTTT